MEKIWLKSYPDWVPAEIQTDQFGSLVELIEKHCLDKAFRLQPAYRNFGVDLTFEQLDQKSRYVAAYLQQKLGLKKGERVALMLPNLLQYPVTLLGILRAGLIAVNVNPIYTASELTYLLQDSATQTIIVLENFAETVQKALSNNTSLKHVIVTQMGDLLPPFKAWMFEVYMKWIKRSIPAWNIPEIISFNKMLCEGKKLSLNPVNIEQKDIAFLQYTGGTTGVPKGAILSHGNVVANVLQQRAWIGPLMQPGKEIVITALPLYHIFSLTVNCFTFIYLNALNVLITNPRDIPRMVKILSKIKFTAMSGVNTLFNALVKNADFAKLDFSQLRFCIAGAMALQRQVAEQWHEITGHPIVQGYGLTEASPGVAANILDSPSYTESVGLPLPSTEVSLRDDAGVEVAIGERGELWVKGPQVMQGYWNNPEETQEVLTPDGWLKTGDIARMDENGFITIVDRKKDLIKVSGFNVYPQEVEDVIAQYPGVAEVAVLGIPSEHSGEAIKAFIVKKDPNITKEAIIRYCHQFLTRYKVPKEIEFREDLPKSNVGKVLRKDLGNAG